jgi:Flp pilus assembly protein TadG
LRLPGKKQPTNLLSFFRKAGSEEKGAELIELAFTLPIFLLIIFGVVDFGGAWAAQDQIECAARNGARVAVSNFNDTTTSNPQCAGGPCSVQAAVDAAVAAFANSGLPTCGMTGAGIGAAAGAFTWSDSAGCPNGGTFTITVARAVPETDNSSGTNTTVLTTQVSISYPYTFKLNMGGGLIYAGNPFATYITLNDTATMVNLN